MRKRILMALAVAFVALATVQLFLADAGTTYAEGTSGWPPSSMSSR